MLGSIDCMHWGWKKCPENGMFRGHVNEPTMILEAVASKDLWIWHALFGLPGSHNDLKVLQCSPLFAKLFKGEAPKVNYTISGHLYTMGYYLAVGIYPPWATFVKTIPDPEGRKKKHLPKDKRELERMWSEPLEFCKPILPLFEDQPKVGNVKKLVTLCKLVS
jgi:hypothetical protein